MRIAIDVSSAVKATRTGVGRYITQLVQTLSQMDTGCEFDLLYRPSRWKRRRHFIRVPGPSFRTRCLLERLHFGYPGRISAFHGPDARLPRFRKVPLVASVHDTFNADSESFANSDFRAKKTRRYLDLARRADVVITCSEYTKGRFLNHTGADPSKVTVIPHGVDSKFGSIPPQEVDRVLERHGLQEPYILYVGQLSRRKNLVRLLESYAPLKQDVLLVLAGPRSHGYDEIEAAHARLGCASRVRFLGPVFEEDLPGLYAGARIHMLLSLDEGFGLPVLEAFMAGTPVLASTKGAIPEVAGDAALLVDPMDEDAILNGIRRLLDDAVLRESLRRKGMERAKEFSWMQTATKTLALYREVAV